MLYEVPDHDAPVQTISLTLVLRLPCPFPTAAYSA